MFERWLVAVLLLTSAAVHADEGPVRDPMQPFRPSAAAPGAPDAPAGYVLTAVLISSARSIAVVNGKPYRLGDRVGAAELVRIEPQAVHLQEAGEDLIIRLRTTRAAVEINQGDSGP